MLLYDGKGKRAKEGQEKLTVEYLLGNRACVSVWHVIVSQSTVASQYSYIISYIHKHFDKASAIKAGKNGSIITTTTTTITIASTATAAASSYNHNEDGRRKK